MPALWGALSAFAAWVGPYVGALFKSRAFWLVAVIAFNDVIYGFVGDVLGMAVHAINSTVIDLPTMAEVVETLPSEALIVLKRVGLDVCMQYIVTAYTIRGALSLIGWVRALKPGAL